MDNLAEVILKRLGELKSDRINVVEQTARDCYDYTIPIRGVKLNCNNFNGPASSLSDSNRKKSLIFDSTAADAAKLFASFIIAGLAPSNVRWADFDVAEKPDFKHDFLDKAADIVWREIHAGNFDSSAYEGMLDLVIAGWCVLFIGYDEGLYFELWNIAGCYFTSSKKGGLVDHVYREYSLTDEQCMREFGRVPEGQPSTQEKQHQFVHAIYPRKSGVQGSALNKEKPYASCHVHIQTGEIYAESGYDEFPLAVPRWHIIPDSSYAVGPVYEALADIKTLNESRKYQLQNDEMAICGMYAAVDDGVINPGAIQIGPRKIIPVSEQGNFQPITPGGDMRTAMADIEMQRAQVRRTLMVDQIQIPQNSNTTATEINVRMDILRQITGPVFGRLQSEFLQRIVARAFGLLMRAGKLPPLPEELANMQSLSIRYVSPLARSQRQSEVVAIESFEQSLMMSAQADPSVLDIYDFDKGNREKAYLRGVPQDVLRDERQVKKLRDDRAKAQQQAAQQQQVQPQ